METKIINKYDVISHFNINEEKLEYIIHKMEKRHPLEDWLYYIKGPDGNVSYYLMKEFYCWLEEVYFNRNGFYLDKEINFFKNQILRLENELNIIHYQKEYSSCTINELCFLFGKNKNAILKGVQRMSERNSDNYKTYIDNQLVISSYGVKWLSENYFRKIYLKELEDYKLKLQQIKKEKKDEQRSN